MRKVTEDDTRAAGAGTPDKCFYCSGKFGENHDPDCVCLEKTVKVALTIYLDHETVESWTNGEIEFHLNESSYCMSNLLDEVEEQVGDGCICHIAEAVVLDPVDVTPKKDLLEEPKDAKTT